MSNQKVSDPSNLKQWFWQTPNLYDDADLDPFEFRLLSHYCRVGNCYESTKTTAAKCHMSTGQVSEKRQTLAVKGFIYLSKSEYDTLQIEIVDKWRENFEAYSQRSPGEPSDSLSETKNTPVQEPNNNKTEPAVSPKQEAWNELREMLMIVSPMDLERFEQLWAEHPDPRRHKFALEQTKKFANPVSSRYYETIFLRYDPERPKERDKPNGRGASLNPTPTPTMYAEAWLEMNAHEGESPQQVLDRLKVEGKVDTRGIVNWRDDAKNTRSHATTR